MIHPPRQDEAHLKPHGNPPRFRFNPKRFKLAITSGKQKIILSKVGRCDIQQHDAVARPIGNHRIGAARADAQIGKARIRDTDEIFTIREIANRVLAIG